MTRLRDALHLLSVMDPTAWEVALVPAFIENEIDTKQRQAGFLANTLYETLNYTKLIENMNYSPLGLLETFPTHFTQAQAHEFGRTPGHPADQESIAELAYGGRLGNGPIGCGDGWNLRGQGLLHLTGRFNLQRFANKIGVTLDELIVMLRTKEGAAMSAAHYWRVTGCNISMDYGNIRESRIKVQGGTRGLTEVTTLYGLALSALGRDPLRAPPSHEAARLNLAELDRIERARTDELNAAELKRVQDLG